MAKRFEPKSINGTKPTGYTRGDIAVTLEHYGYIRAPGREGHFQFKHREYKDIMKLLVEEGLHGQKRDYHQLTLTLPNHAGDMSAVYVKMAADACLKVQELNARRREGENLEEFPEWVHPMFDGLLKDDGAPKFDQRLESGALRLFREPDDEARRSYRVTYTKSKGGHTLHATNLNFPEYEMNFTVRNSGKVSPDECLRQFVELDEQVKTHITERERGYYVKLGRLIANRGFVVERDDPDLIEVPMMHVSHPSYEIAEDLLRIPEHETVADESIELVDDMLEGSEALYLLDDIALDRLKDKGWSVNILPDDSTQQFSEDEYESIGRGSFIVENQRAVQISSPDKNTIVEFPVYGELLTLGVHGLQLAKMVGESEDIMTGETPSATIQEVATHEMLGGKTVYRLEAGAIAP